MLFTSLTSAVGFLSLLLTPIPPVQVFGVFVAFGILLAFMLTITLIPAYVVRMKAGSRWTSLLRMRRTPHTNTFLARALRSRARRIRDAGAARLDHRPGRAGRWP